MRSSVVSLAAVACGAVLLHAAPAGAQSSPWSIGLAQTLGHESNLLRLGNGAATPEGFSRSDTVSSTALVAGLDQPVGRQRLFGNLTLRDNRFDRNDFYDNRSHAFTLGLDWSTVERLSGLLRASSNRALAGINSTEVGLLRQKNLERTDNVDALVRVGLVTEYTAELGLARRKVDNSLDNPVLQARQFEQDTASLGLRWQPSDRTSLGVALRHNQGRYPQFQRDPLSGEFQADRFKSTDLDLNAVLLPSGASRIELRLSQGRTRYDLNQQRNFDGGTGSLKWNWTATGKTRLVSSVVRERGQDSYALTFFDGTPGGAAGSADYSRVTDSLRLRLDHDASAKIALFAALSGVERKIVRTVSVEGAPPDEAPPSGRERAVFFSLGLRWAPTRSVQLGCEAGHEDRRGSGPLGQSLRSASASCYGQFTLQ